MALLRTVPEPVEAGARRPYLPLMRQARSIAADALLPLALFLLVRRWGSSESHAIMVAATAPLASAALALRRDASLSPTSIVVFSGMLVTLVALALGGSPQILLLRESLVTAGLGAACLVSVPFRRPLMFYFVRHLAAAGDATKFGPFTDRLHSAPFVRALRVVTAVWGVNLLLEFLARAWLIYHAKPATVLAVSPLMMNGIIFSTLTWALWYGKRKGVTL